MGAGAYGNFVVDGWYGLAQWTYHSRKAALLAYVQERGVSVGDLAAQLQFLMQRTGGLFLRSQNAQVRQVHPGSV